MLSSATVVLEALCGKFAAGFEKRGEKLAPEKLSAGKNGAGTTDLPQHLGSAPRSNYDVIVH